MTWLIKPMSAAVSRCDGSCPPLPRAATRLSSSRLVLRVLEPDELITVSLQPVGEHATDLTYDFESSPPPTDEAAARRGVEDMLDRIEAGVGLGII
jgi:hypothetical protein